MSLVKKSELKQMTKEQINNKLKELNKELMRLNAQRFSGTAPENPGKIKQIKKTIAKLLIRLYSLKKLEGGQT